MEVMPNLGEFKFKELFRRASSAEELQTRRREEYLLQIKSLRSSALNEKRGIYEVLESIDSDHAVLLGKNTEISDQTVSSPKTVHAPSTVTRPRRGKSPYCNKLMMSEWMLSIPADFERDWYFKLCPRGKRTLVVAMKALPGRTVAYSRQGKQMGEYKSNLPGGNTTSESNLYKFTILDCIFNLTHKKYFVLDIIAWNSHNFVDLSAECRFFMLKSKLEEVSHLPSKFQFHELEAKPCELSLLEQSLAEPFVLEEDVIGLDGVLFYHKSGTYRSKISVLALWLKVFMVPEVFHVPVHPNFRTVPDTYVDFDTHVQSVTTRKRFNKKKKGTAHCDMECVTQIEEESSSFNSECYSEDEAVMME